MHTHTHTLKHSHSFLSRTHPYTPTHSLSLSHTQTLSLFCSFSLSIIFHRNKFAFNEKPRAMKKPFYYVLFFNWKKSTAAFLGFVQENSNTKCCINKVLFKWHKFGWNLFDKHIQCYIILHFKTWQREFHLEGKVWWRFAQICSPLQTVYQLVTFQLIYYLIVRRVKAVKVYIRSC